MGDVNYADYLAAHLSEALNKTLEKMPDNPFRAMYDVLFAASLLDGAGPLPTPAAAPTSPEIEKYMETYRLETMIESCKFKLKKRLVPGPLEGVKFLISDAADFFTEESKKLKAAGGKMPDLGMTAEELAAKDAADKKAKREKEAKAEAERDAADAINAEKTKEMEASGKKVSGGLHKFDASEVDINGGSGTADDFMDAFGF